MNVVCGHCSTAYEFDDALVAKRGTMVKCSRCAHQFRVFPNAEQATLLSEDRWLVRKPSGKTVEFSALRDLQQALIAGSVTVSDELSRDGKLFKPIHAVPELESFLPHEPPRPSPDEQTLTGMPSAAPVSSSLPTPRTTTPGPHAPVNAAPANEDDEDDEDITAVYSAAQIAHLRRAASSPTPASQPSPPPPPPPPVGRSTPPTVKTPTAQSSASLAPSFQSSSQPQHHGGSGRQVAAAVQSSASLAPVQSSAQPTNSTSGVTRVQPSARTTPSQDFAAVNHPSTKPPEPPGSAEPPQQSPTDVPVAPQQALQQRRAGRRPLTPLVTASSPPPASTLEPELQPVQPDPEEEDEDEEEDDDSELESLPPTAPPPSRGLRWVLGILLLGGLGLVAATVGKEYLQPYLQPAVQNRPDARIDSLLSLGHELYRQSDVEGASEQFERASALSKTHPGVIEGQLLVQLTRCDSLWLWLRLLPEDSAERASVNAQLSEQLEKLQVLSQGALDAASNAPELTALILDSYRIQGQQAAARKRAGELSAHATEPRTAYVLAMLDLAEEEPVWPTVLERLRTALGVERSPGRAGAALVYALARSGDMDTAQVELERLQGIGRPHALYEPLAAFLQRPSDPSETP